MSNIDLFLANVGSLVEYVLARQSPFYVKNVSNKITQIS